MKRLLISTIAILMATTPLMASSVRGSRIAKDTVGGYTNISYYETLYAHEDTVVTLSGDCVPGQDIDLWVYDENNNLVDKSTSYGCDEIVVFRPLWTGPFKIVVENSNHPFDTYFQLNID